MAPRITGLFGRGARAVITQLEDHPHATDVLAVLCGLADIRDADLPRLAELWTNDVEIAAARALALSADAPLVIEVLAAFEALEALFADDLRGEADFVNVDPEVTATALKSVRDAIAASYARPILSRRQHLLLVRPWQTVFPDRRATEPDLGPRAAAVRELLGSLPVVAGRCHDPSAAAAYDDLVLASWQDESSRRAAADEAFQVAVRTDRRRTWALVRRSAAEGLQRPCGTCGGRAADADLPRVHTAVADAACALLVADLLPAGALALLTTPVGLLVPQPRSPIGPGEQLLG